MLRYLTFLAIALLMSALTTSLALATITPA